MESGEHQPVNSSNIHCDDENYFLPLFSYKRYRRGGILRIFAFAVCAFILYTLGLGIFAIIPLLLIVLTVVTKSLVTVQYQKPVRRTLVGSKCRVIRTISGAERGIVKVYRPDGMLDDELWSAESSGGDRIEKGKDVQVIGIRSIILLVE